MKSHPPSVGRIERVVVGIVAFLITVLWIVGEGSSAVMRSETVAVPPGLGWSLLLVVLAIITLNAFFVACETSVELLTSLHVKHAPNTAAQERLQAIFERQAKFVAACSLGSQLARLALFFVGLMLAENITVLMSGNETTNFNQLLTTAILVGIPIVLLNLILGELVPKSFATIHVSSVANRFYRFIQATSIVFSIPASMVVYLANGLTRRFGGKATFSMANHTEEQIRNLVESAQESGDIESEERELLHSVFEFSDTVVREVMTPRVDLEAMPVESDPLEIVKMIEATGHSRIPIYEDTDDQILGIIHAKDLLLCMVEGRRVSVRALMRPPIFLPEILSVQEALTEMRLNRSQIAVVQDEFGGTAGIVTIEDIVEELVGEIVDEYDTEETASVKTESGYLFEGKTHIDDVNEQLDSNFESDVFDTIGGYVFGLFGRQPKLDETIEAEGFVFRVEDTDSKRILRLEIHPIPAILFPESDSEN